MHKLGNMVNLITLTVRSNRIVELPGPCFSRYYPYMLQPVLFSLSLFRSLFLSLARSLSLSLGFSLAFSLARSLTLTRSHFFSMSLFLALSHTLFSFLVYFLRTLCGVMKLSKTPPPRKCQYHKPTKTINVEWFPCPT